MSLERSSTSSFDEKDGSAIAEPATAAVSRRTWFRTSFFQITIVGLCAFLSPGLWNSMNSLGAGGGQSPFLANAANSIVFGLMVLTCLLGSTITNKLSYRWALVLGACGYAPYAGGLVLNLKTGASWLVYLGSVTCGLSAGLFWSVEGAIALGYPEENKRGRYLSYWLAWRNGGQILGGAISLGLNAKGNKIGAIGRETYYVFIALQAFAPFVAVLLSNPPQVQRKDRTPVKMENHIGLKAELKEVWDTLTRREVLWLVPVSLFAQWPSSYVNTFFSLYFTVRARALGSLLIAILSVIGNVLLGFWLDNKRVSKKIKTRVAFVGLMTIFGGVFIWLTILQTRFLKHKPKLDWTDGRAFSEAFGAYVIFYIVYYTLQNVLYYIFSELARNPKELIRLSSILRGAESAGSACGYGVSARKVLPMTVPLGIDFGLWGVAFAAAMFTVKDVGTKWELNKDVKEEKEDEAH
ncbi:Major Facilitator Superfamily protein [Rhodotorula toruloides]|uniref:BY PROTMAP: gi/472585605/gb/EMS23156.1/ Major Facilitator Superfamily protein [Rhodosporidium toruloides NP11] gi/647400710/emb/CDR46407.1/ RHTO0S12e04126g1_1 [Rhodosporidium toruloides] n=1 Tax=Rhodotorula toruloides TaxID=5286 RepID=A0A0K3CM01_RHOTO|nr:Major Facilitator Superfamily protein [Rhodotorula toruloides]PRQ70704.1 Major facilitator superfamily domain-containing protein [Rhodotorula toruloides]